MLSSRPLRRWQTNKDSRTSSSRTDRVIFHDADWLAGVDYEDEDECEEYADEDEEYEDNEEQDIELEEAINLDPREIDDIIEDEANPNEHQDDGDHQESEENTEIEELNESEPGVPSESETYVPLDPQIMN